MTPLASDSDRIFLKEHPLHHRKSKRIPEKHLFPYYTKSVTVWITANSKIFQEYSEMRIPEHLTCLLRNMYAGQEVAVTTGHGTTDCFQIGKGVHQGCILSPCLFNLYAEYIMRNTGLNEAQAGIKIAGRNISNFRYADDYSRKRRGTEEPLYESERGG